MALDKNQTALIADEVRKASIELDDLREELIDHLCCETELLMEKGYTFEQAHEQVKKQASIRTLRSVQDNVIQQLDKKYSLMKNTMKITGNLSLVLVTAGTIMKIFGVAGWAVVLTVAIALLCLLFLPLALVTSRNTIINKRYRDLEISVFVAGMFFSAGILFRIMQWTGANIILAVSFAVSLLLVLPLAWKFLITGQEVGYKRRLFTFGIFSMAIFVLATAFKMFHLPAASVLMAVSSILLISIFLPLYSYHEMRKKEAINAQFIYIIIASVYVMSMVILMSIGSPGKFIQ